MAALMRDSSQGFALAQRREGCPAEMTPTMGPPKRLFHLTEQGGQVLLGGRPQAAGEEDLSGETIAPNPQDLVAHVGWSPSSARITGYLLGTRWSRRGSANERATSASERSRRGRTVRGAIVETAPGQLLRDWAPGGAGHGAGGPPGR